MKEERLNVLEVLLASFGLEKTETEEKAAALQSSIAFTYVESFMLAIILIARYVINSDAGIPLSACIACVVLIAIGGLFTWIGDHRRDRWANIYPDEWYGRMPQWYITTIRMSGTQDKLMRVVRKMAVVVTIANIIMAVACIYPPIASHSLFTYCVMPATVAGSVLLNVADEWAHDVEFYAVWQNVLAHKASEAETEPTEE